MKTAVLSLIFVSAAAVACGSSQPAPAAPATTTGSEQGHEHKEHKEGQDEHAALTPALKDFHTVLSPVWHADAGATRIEKACTNVKAMAEKATATNDAELIADVKEVDAACAKDGKPEVETKLKAVHERFHVVAKIPQHDHKDGHEDKH